MTDCPENEPYAARGRQESRKDAKTRRRTPSKHSASLHIGERKQNPNVPRKLAQRRPIFMVSGCAKHMKDRGKTRPDRPCRSLRRHSFVRKRLDEGRVGLVNFAAPKRVGETRARLCQGIAAGGAVVTPNVWVDVSSAEPIQECRIVEPQTTILRSKRRIVSGKVCLRAILTSGE